MLQVRALNEYAITLRWMVIDPVYNALLLAIDNIRALLDDEVQARGRAS